MPGKVRVSRIYFKPDRMLTGRLRQNMDFFRYPLSKYFPHEMLRPETLERERAQTPNKPEDETKDINTVTGWKHWKPSPTGDFSLNALHTTA